MSTLPVGTDMKELNSLPVALVSTAAVLDKGVEVSFPQLTEMSTLPVGTDVKELNSLPVALVSTAAVLDEGVGVSFPQLTEMSTQLVGEEISVVKSSTGLDKQISVSDKLPETVNINMKKIRSVNSVSSQSSISCSSSSSSNKSNKSQIKESECLPQRHGPVILDDDDLQICSSMITNISNTESLVEATNRVFKVDQVYKSHLHFKKHVTYFADCWGFTVARAGHDFKCSRGGCLQKRKLQPNLGVRKTIQNKIRCEWMIRLRPITVKIKKALGYDLLTDLGEKSVFVKLVSAVHSNGCCPGRNQYIICKKKAGGYAKELNVILHQLVSHMTLKDNGFADSFYIRALMKKSLPNGKAISRQNIFNVRV
jgi:hypothetical protein